MNACPCGTGLAYEECCGPIIEGTRNASSAEQLMRSRYTAYAKKNIGYLYSSLHPDHRKDYDEKSTRQWAERSQWHSLEIVDTRGGGEEDTEGTVEFIAAFTSIDSLKALLNFLSVLYLYLLSFSLPKPIFPFLEAGGAMSSRIASKTILNCESYFFSIRSSFRARSL